MLLYIIGYGDNMSLKGIFKDCDKVLLIASLILCLFGLFNIVNVSSQEVTNKLVDTSIYHYFYRQLIFLIASFILVLFILSHPMDKNKPFMKLLFMIALVGNFIVVAKGVSTRGANNWIKFGGISIQPSELSKPIIITYLAFLFERYAKFLKNPKVDHTNVFFKILVVGFIIPVLVFLQKDLGTLTIIALSFITMLWFAPILKKDRLQIFKYLIFIVVVCLIGVSMIKGSVLTGAQQSRLDFFDPCDSKKFQNGGYQVCNAFIAINRGGLTGVGIGKSTQKYSYIPEPHTDMVFAIISEEYGFIVGLIIILLYALILYRIFDLASYATSMSGRYMCLGIGVYIFAHIFINLGGMFGIIPLTGVPLPFLSYGGSFLVSLVASIAIVERVYIDTKRAKVF